MNSYLQGIYQMMNQMAQPQPVQQPMPQQAPQQAMPQGQPPPEMAQLPNSYISPPIPMNQPANPNDPYPGYIGPLADADPKAGMMKGDEAPVDPDPNKGEETKPHSNSKLDWMKLYEDLMSHTKDEEHDSVNKELQPVDDAKAVDLLYKMALQAGYQKV